MDVITYGLSKIHKSIPKQVLDLRYNFISDVYTNTNKNITDIVIKGDVLVDLNLISCNQKVVRVNDLEFLREYGDSKIYNVPLSLTNGLPIMDVIGVIDTELVAVNTSINEQFGGVNAQTTVRAYLVNRHTVSISNEFFSNDGYLELTLAYDERMKEIMPNSYPVIAEAFILATKADIYNELVITMDEGALYYGYDISSIRTEIEKYSDARELYEAHKEETVAKVLFMNSDDTMTDWVQMLMPNQT